MGKKKANARPVTTVGELMDALRGGKTKVVNIPVRAGSGSAAQHIRQGKIDRPAKPPRELSDFDGLMRRLNKHYGKRLSDQVLLKAVAAVAERKGCLVHHVRRMTFADFNAAMDDAMGQPRYGPDPDKPILYWDGTPYPFTRRNWQFLLVVWGKHNVPFLEISEAVWGDDATRSSTIRQRVHQVNRQLTEHGLDLAFTSEGEQVRPLAGWPK